MVTMYVDGAKVGTLDENPDLLKQLLESRRVIEFRTDDGEMLGEFKPSQEPLVPWDSSITREELDRRAAEAGGMTLDAFWKSRGVRSNDGVCEWESGLTREEIDRRVRESKRSSLDNILKRLDAE